MDWKNSVGTHVDIPMETLDFDNYIIQSNGGDKGASKVSN